MPFLYFLPSSFCSASMYLDTMLNKLFGSSQHCPYMISLHSSIIIWGKENLILRILNRCWHSAAFRDAGMRYKTCPHRTQSRRRKKYANKNTTSQFDWCDNGSICSILLRSPSFGVSLPGFKLQCITSHLTLGNLLRDWLIISAK